MKKSIELEFHIANEHEEEEFDDNKNMSTGTIMDMDVANNCEAILFIDEDKNAIVEQTEEDSENVKLFNEILDIKEEEEECDQIIDQETDVTEDDCVLMNDVNEKPEKKETVDNPKIRAEDNQENKKENADECNENNKDPLSMEIDEDEDDNDDDNDKDDDDNDNDDDDIVFLEEIKSEKTEKKTTKNKIKNEDDFNTTDDSETKIKKCLLCIGTMLENNEAWIFHLETCHDLTPAEYEEHML